MHITFIISSLAAGGAERVISTMANFWAKKGWEIRVITMDSPISDFYELDPSVKRIVIDLMEKSDNSWLAIKNNLRRISRLRREIKKGKPDVVISFIDRMNVLTLLATRCLDVKVIVSERTHPAYHNIGRTWSWLRRISYPWADIIVSQSSVASDWLRNEIRNVSPAIIANPVRYPEEKTFAKRSLKQIIGKPEEAGQIVLGMGRLAPPKGFDLLLRGFAGISTAQSAWLLVIFGEGDERNSLEYLARELGIADRVFLPGIVQNPMPLMREADLFVLSSRFEGFPNALLEAMAEGLPVISFDCPSGPREIIQDGINGRLVPPGNVAALSAAMSDLMENSHERKRLAERAHKGVQRFNLENIMSIWENIISRITGGLCVKRKY